MCNSSSDRLKSARLKTGLRQIDVAKRMKRSVSTIKNWEQEGGSSPGSLDDIAKLCEIVGISIDYYIKGRNNRTRFTQDDIKLIDLAKKMKPETRIKLHEIAKMLIDIEDRDMSQNSN